MRTWDCATEEAVDSLSEDFSAGQTSCKTMHDAIEDNGDAFRSMGRNGWDGIEGDYAEGLKYLTDVLGRQIVEVSHRAFALERFHRVASEGLEPLETESATLLGDAEAAFERYAAGENGYSMWARVAVSRQQRRDREERDSDEWHQADRSFWSAMRERNAHLTARNAAADELDTMQTTFDTLRDDEEQVHQNFADGLGRIPLDETRVDVDPSASAAASVDRLMNLFDAALLTMSGNPRAGTARARLAALRAAREAIAAMGDVDIDEHDDRVEGVRLLRDFNDSTLEEMRDRIKEALRNGDTEEAGRLARMLELGVAGMTLEERNDYLFNLVIELETFGSGWLHLITLFAAKDGAIPPWMADVVFDLEWLYAHFFIADQATREMLAGILGVDPNEPWLSEEVLLVLFRRILETPYGREQLEAMMEGDGSFQGPYAAMAAYEYLLDNPDVFGDLLTSEAGPDVERVQRLLDLASEGVTNDQMDVLFDRLVVYLIETGETDPDTDVSGMPGQDMAQYADEIGGLLYQFGRAGEGDSYNPAGIMRFLAETAVGAVPHGSTALKFIKGGEAFFDGYEESTLYADLVADGDRHVDETLIAVGAIISAGGPIAESLAAMALEAGDPIELYTRLNEDSGGDLSQYVDEIRQEVVGGISEAERGD